MGGNSAPNSPTRRSATPNPGKTQPQQQQQQPRRGKLKSSQALNMQEVIDSCRTNFARDMKKTFMFGDDPATPPTTQQQGIASTATSPATAAPGRTRSASSLSPKTASSASSKLDRLARSTSARNLNAAGGVASPSSSSPFFGDENSRKLARRVWEESCQRASSDNFKTAPAAAASPAYNGRISRSRSSLLMISSEVPSGQHPQSGQQEESPHSKSALPSPTDRRCSPRTVNPSKSSSAPPSPVKAVSTVVTSPKQQQPPKMQQERVPRKRPVSSLGSEEPTSNKRSRTVSNGEVSSSTEATPAPADSSTKVYSSSSTATPPPMKARAAPMDEVMKLHQDEGVLHLLHALPTSRRKDKVNYFPTKQQQDHQAAGQQSRKANSLLGSLNNHHHKRLSSLGPSSSSSGSTGGRDSPLLSLASQLAATQASGAAFGSGKHHKKAKGQKKNHLVRVGRDRVSPVSPEDLLNPKVLDLLKKLPKDEYLHLWSSTTRYKLAEDALALATGRDADKQSSVSPDSSVGSDISSVSAARSFRARIGERMLTNVTLLSRQYVHLQLRSYPNFTQIMLCPSPSSAGMKHALTAACMDELVDALELVRDRGDGDPTCSAVLVTGMVGSGIFCQGVDLTQLTHEGLAEKQRKSAESLAAAIRRLVSCLVSYPRVTAAAVNGSAVGLGVTLLPYFDLVYASDKATFRTDYARLGQVPEGFASVGMAAAVAGSGPAREMLLLGREITAEEAATCGIVTAVVWPDRIMEEIVPRMEQLDDLSQRGLQATKAYLRASTKRRVAEVAEEETRLLVRSWTGPDFAKNLKNYLKTSDQIVFQ